ncbi:hypothetical protein [Actinotalea fermentans]|uniref:Uncharacterized protein n=1 Tax=Actinotalea fermentans TaxID=43671 RepID=A0A511YZQ4_9CELL|nr:hypothetical protein [Actinotalea fermentans]KGM16967.1 hypothetical protein N867_12525 [Actinotalea fermentans ATCC 43279 = JCM 9966 = DSM 3133]GEN80701.1 hypothetical protein AFE02nite_24350 [Actinotalea fermentans]
MTQDKAFVVMQVGEKDSIERRRADDIYNYIVTPALTEFGITPYRADLDPSPGGITAKMLSELINSRLIIADLTGRNPNVFYELGIVHAFAKPLISVAEAVTDLPFDTKDERVIELGMWGEAGLTYVQGEQAKQSLRESLKIVLAEGYTPPSPLRDLAANRSIDELAPENPVAAELAQMRATLDELRHRVMPRPSIPQNVREDLKVLRETVERNLDALEEWELDALWNERTSANQDQWATEMREKWSPPAEPVSSDPWATPPSPGTNPFVDEPPF